METQLTRIFQRMEDHAEKGISRIEKQMKTFDDDMQDWNKEFLSGIATFEDVMAKFKKIME
ncbi:hypothetical protein [Lentibacillus salinarum]|uniref:LXG domain-containing protein n=1 Tax=Lentibacillus salinarum TaxID=446820 RepID=A0ABW3ZPJ0_9BACI